MITKFSIGITAYNEKKGLELLLLQLTKYKWKLPPEIIVVCSACTDGSNELVEKFIEKFQYISLIKEKKRKGKRSAVNKIFKYSKTDIIVLLPADIITTKKNIEKLIFPLKYQSIGCVGGKVKLIQRERESLVTRISNVIWEFHDIALIKRTLEGNVDHASGELIALKKSIVNHIPKLINDDMWISYKVRQENRKIIYNNSAIVYTLPPWTFRDYFNQRFRIFNGHRTDLKGFKKNKTNLKNPLRKIDSGIYILTNTIRKGKFSIQLIFLTIFLEFFIKIASFLEQKNDFVWKISNTTKI